MKSAFFATKSVSHFKARVAAYLPLQSARIQPSAAWRSLLLAAKDAHGIAECALASARGGTVVISGRGIGAAHALNEDISVHASQAILIDPAKSTAAEIHKKYGAFFPEFLAGKGVFIHEPVNRPSRGIVILEDRRERSSLTAEVLQSLGSKAVYKERGGGTLADALSAFFNP